MTAETLMLLGGVAAFLLTLHWVRSRTMSERHAVVWLIVATAMLVMGLFPSLIKMFAQSVQLSYPAAVLAVALGAIYLFSMSVSVSLSRQRKRNVRLAQEFALLRHELDQLRQEWSESEQRGRSARASAPSSIS